MSSSSTDDNRLRQWLTNGFNQGRSGRNPPQPPRPTDEELDDESEDYLDGDPGKKNNPANQNVAGHSKWMQRNSKDLPGGVKRACAGCKRDIDGGVLARLGTYFHPWCFCCRACGRPITELEFSLSGGNPFHKSCLPQCDVCHSGRHDRIQIDPFWPQKYCPWHKIDNTPRCNSCGRLQPWGIRYITLGGGRRSCSECMDSAILDDDECEQLYGAIIAFYEGMNFKFDQEFPVKLDNRSREGYHHLCSLSLVERPIEDRSNTGRPASSQKMKDAALILESGYPRLVSGSTLAKMQMEAWLWIRGYPTQTPELQAVIQVVPYMWLESQVMSTTSSLGNVVESEFERKLGVLLMYEIDNNSQAKREVFLAANAAVKRYGLRNTLNYVLATGTLPFLN